jgi:hypothetical protein
LSRSVCVRACVRAKRFHLSDHHWKQALVALVPTRNCPASCPHAYLSGIESSRANGVQRQRGRTPVHVEGGPTGWAAPAAQSDCAHGCTIARLVPARGHPQTRIWSGTAHSVRILDAPGPQTDEFNERTQRSPTVSASTLEHETTQRAGYCMDGSEIGPVQRSTGGRSLGRTERRRGRAGGRAAAYVMLVRSGQVRRLITVVITS